jgi:hypothetical protein
MVAPAPHNLVRSNQMTDAAFIEPTARELAHRVNDGLEVTLFWQPGTDELLVCVCDQRRGAYFEVRPRRHLALDVFYHPYSYTSLSDVHYEDERLAASF